LKVGEEGLCIGRWGFNTVKTIKFKKGGGCMTPPQPVWWLRPLPYSISLHQFPDSVQRLQPSKLICSFLSCIHHTQFALLTSSHCFSGGCRIFGGGLTLYIHIFQGDKMSLFSYSKAILCMGIFLGNLGGI